jgi:hypothetical protein
MAYRESWHEKEKNKMSTPTTSTLSSTQTLNQSGNGTPVVGAVKLAVKLPPNSTPGINGGFTVGAQIPTPSATYVHGKELDGDRGGDTRKTVSGAFSTEFAKNPPAPREPVRQAQMVSSKLPDGKVPVPVTGESLASQS